MKIPIASVQLLLLLGCGERALAGSINARGNPKGNGQGGRQAPVDMTGVGNLRSESSMNVTPLKGNRRRSFNRVNKPKSNPNGFYGEPPERDGSSINLIQCGSSVCGSMNDIKNGTVVNFRHDANGEAYAVETPYDAFAPDAEPEFIDLGDETMPDSSGSRRLLRGLSSNPIIDIMVLWTPGAECRISNLTAGCTLTGTTEQNMRDEIDVALTETNTAYENSGINAQMRLAHAYRVEGYDESDRTDPYDSTDGLFSSAYRAALYRMQRSSDGWMDDIASKRTSYGADMVAMIINDGQYCGMAFRPSSHTTAKNSMFSVSSHSCFTGYFTFGHETGHNLGMKHDRGAQNSCNENDTNGNYGYRHPQAHWRTIMAYTCTSTVQCDGVPAGFYPKYCGKIQHFSSSTVMNNNEPTGSSGGAGTLGKIDNAAQANAVAAIVEAYYDVPSVASCSVDGDCDDTDECTTDSCGGGGTCSNIPINCDDENACTTDSCNVATGCSNVAITCDDGDACTTNSCDTLTGCSFDAIDCDDLNSCTLDSCSDGVCFHTLNCDDEDACTQDSCEAGECSYTSITCDDEDACTTDSCDAETGCIFDAINCDDEDACTADSCDAETGCFALPITCDDEDPCTTDSCDAVTGCSNVPMDCDDQDVCTDDSCNNGECFYTATTCDDGASCTLNTCDSALGCKFETDPNNPCPLGTVCEAFNDCVDINECTSNPCGNDATCTNSYGSFTCVCNSGFEGDGYTCTNTDNCSPNPCLNGGICTDGVDSFTCDCLSGFSGTLCEISCFRVGEGSPCDEQTNCCSGRGNCSGGSKWSRTCLGDGSTGGNCPPPPTNGQECSADCHCSTWCKGNGTCK